jgi:hypothetical protein
VVEVWVVSVEWGDSGSGNVSGLFPQLLILFYPLLHHCRILHVTFRLVMTHDQRHGSTDISHDRYFALAVKEQRQNYFQSVLLAEWQNGSCWGVAESGKIVLVYLRLFLYNILCGYDAIQ